MFYNGGGIIVKIDFTRLIVVIIGFFVAQIIIQSFLSMLGISGLAFVILYNLLLAFVATLIYYPEEKLNLIDYYLLFF